MVSVCVGWEGSMYEASPLKSPSRHDIFVRFVSIRFTRYLSTNDIGNMSEMRTRSQYLLRLDLLIFVWIQGGGGGFSKEGLGC